MKSGGAMPRPTQILASSEATLGTMAAGAMGGTSPPPPPPPVPGGDMESPWGAFILAAGGGWTERTNKEKNDDKEC